MSHSFTVHLETAWQAARAAGALIRENWQKPKEIGYKGAIDLVTSIDRESEHLIVDALRKSFPDHSILAEEETEIAGSENRYRWIVDPLDGTTNFAHGYPQFCVSIALERDGEIVLGLVYDPLSGECFTAVTGQGATLNGKPVHTSAVEILDQSLLATGFPYDHRENPDFYLAFFKAFTSRTQGIRRGGSAALDLCYLACGRLDGFWELKLRPWDLAAATLIVKEAGGKLSDFAGKPFSIWGTETLASNGIIHDEMAKITKSTLKSYVD
jgi:myo-inositol-1(or 4)-monophosphatase